MKKSVLLLHPYSNLQCLSSSFNGRTFTSQNSSPRIQRSQYRAHSKSDQDAQSAHFRKDHCWPDLPHPTAVPTPYQILRVKRGESYNKHRFYQLVKLYHPDRSRNDEQSDHISTLPGTVKTERYRLIVAAHEILSDPVRRTAYDQNGAGWDGRPVTEHDPYYSTAWRDSKWSGFDTKDSPFYNATWEDWEKWYRRDQISEQHTVYTSNSGFLTLVVLAVFVGAWGQSMLIGQHDSTFKNQVRQANEHAGSHLRSRREASQDLEKNDRVEHFLKTRHDTGYSAWYTEPSGEKGLKSHGGSQDQMSNRSENKNKCDAV